MKQLSEQTAASIADAHQILGSETPETNLSKRNSKKPKADENCTLLASNATVRLVPNSSILRIFYTNDLKTRLSYPIHIVIFTKSLCLNTVMSLEAMVKLSPVTYRPRIRAVESATGACIRVGCLHHILLGCGPSPDPA